MSSKKFNPFTGKPDFIGLGASIGGTLTGGTAGSVLFVGAGPVLSQDNANFFWDDTKNALGIGRNNPSFPLDIKSTVTDPVAGADGTINTVNILATTTLTNPANTYFDGQTYQVIWTGAGGPIQGLNGLDMSVTYSGSGTMVDGIYGIASFVNVNGAGATIPNVFQLSLGGGALAGGNTITNQYGLFINDMTGAATNYAIKTGLGRVEFGDRCMMYNAVATAGWGVPAIYAAGRLTAKTSAQASVATYTVGAADGSFEVSANVNVTASTTHNFTVTCAYTDETNTARTLTMSFTLVAGGTLVTAVANANGTVPYMGIPQHIRAKAATAITIATTGTFTNVTYNVESVIKQIA